MDQVKEVSTSEVDVDKPSDSFDQFETPHHDTTDVDKYHMVDDQEDCSEDQDSFADITPMQLDSGPGVYHLHDEQLPEVDNAIIMPQPPTDSHHDQLSSLDKCEGDDCQESGSIAEQSANDKMG